MSRTSQRKQEARWLLNHRHVLKRELQRWERVARPKQIRPDGSRLWILHTGRGWGKTRTAAQDQRRAIELGCEHLLAIGPTSTDVHDVMVPMMMRVLEDLQPLYRRSIEAPSIVVGKSTIHLRSGQRIDRCRGLEVGHVWADEVDHWRPELLKPWEAWVSVVEPTCRKLPAQFVVTSTPRRGGLLARLVQRTDAAVTRGHTRENQANLSSGFVDGLSEAFAGSWLERQELAGEIVVDLDGALVTRGVIEAHRVATHPSLRRVVVGVDPSGGEADQGIVCAGIDDRKHVYVLADRTCRLSPDGWGRRVVATSDEFEADRIVAEANYGGAMVESTIKTIDPSASIRLVTASRGKHVRFEPVGALYEQGRIHHVGSLPDLEDEVTMFTGNGYEGTESPNRADALVWAVTELALRRKGVSPADLYGVGGMLGA